MTKTKRKIISVLLMVMSPLTNVGMRSAMPGCETYDTNHVTAARLSWTNKYINK